ncbi:hypothetical protein GCM10023206_32710 [Acinetobacter puyangensis]|uniref:Uncharacterized protein n=1 Tax=Acinetobacter puyangensis TaxID=1096779 RepID=A0A240EDE9_9GAMM|nr:hypothetical protein SAMN05421731_1177 [Acinetobacter puyangensis]
MQHYNNLKLVIYLALISISGIIMMLILDGIYDEIMLIITIIPLLFGAYRAYKINKR